MASWQARAATWLLKRRKFRHEPGFDVAEARKRIRRMGDFFPYPWHGVRVRPALGAPVPAEWVEPRGLTTKRTMVFLHGGAYLFCSPRTHRGMTAFFARNIPARVLVPDYRLAPEHPFPAALDDALACVRWLRESGVPNDEIIFAGDSAGGGLALAVMLALRDAGEPLPMAAACCSPWTDLAATGDSIQDCTHTDAWVFGESVGLAAGLYLGETPATHPHASPLYGDLSGLPPLLIHASDCEIIRDDSIRFVEKARAAGVRAECKIWPGLPHVWQGFVPFVPEACRSLLEFVQFFATVKNGKNP